MKKLSFEIWPFTAEILFTQKSWRNVTQDPLGNMSQDYNPVAALTSLIIFLGKLKSFIYCHVCL